MSVTEGSGVVGDEAGPDDLDSFFLSLGFFGEDLLLPEAESFPFPTENLVEMGKSRLDMFAGLVAV